MSSDHKTPNERATAFSFGVRELRKAKVEQALRLDTGPLKVVNEHPGADPYNTSGSFDRTKNWMRVGKR